MKQPIVALACFCGLLVGMNQPGTWVANLAGMQARGYDILVHDHYFIVRPEVLLVNFVIFAIVAYGLMRLRVQKRRGHKGGVRA